MRTEVIMPQMGESVAEGTITKWLKNIGEKVERDEPLFELTTDKVDADVPSPVDGVLVEILAQTGETVAINTLVAIIDTEASEGTSTQGNSNGAVQSAESVSLTEASSSSPSVSKEIQVSTSGNFSAETNADVARLRQTRSTPLVRRIALDHGISDLSIISGTGLSGRVTKKDILSFIETEKTTPTSQTLPVLQSSRPPVHLPDVQVGPRDRIELMSPQRQAIAQHMIASRATSAHAQTIHEVDFSAVVKARNLHKKDFEARGARLTFTAYLIKAVAEVLQEYPMLNSAMSGNSIVYRGDINIGVAVDTGSSLIVPVVRNADELSLLGIARAVADLAERARTKKLKPDDVQSGTFTVSNPGIFGSEFGIPIINQPQTAILVSGGIKKRVVVDQETDAIMVRPTSIWCLSFDHRVIDGATADRFMRRLREVIETWSPENM